MSSEPNLEVTHPAEAAASDRVAPPQAESPLVEGAVAGGAAEGEAEAQAEDAAGAPSPASSSPSPAPSAIVPAAAHAKRHEGVLGFVQSLAVTIVIAVFVITMLVQAFQIPSQSMENTLLIGDYLLVDKVHYGEGGMWGSILPYSAIRRGDIIVFRYPVHPAQHFVKRVVGIPGDRIRLINKRVLVNGVPVAEPFVVHKDPGLDNFRDNFPKSTMSNYIEARWWLELQQGIRGGEITVPRGQYFVLGDNRDESLDSRYWGFVPRENIIGRPLVIYLSLRQKAAAEGDGNEGANDTLSRLVFSATHLLQFARWERTFRLVR